MLSKQTTFTFTPSDIKTCIAIGSERYWKDKKSGIREQRYVSASKRSGLDLDVFGVVGEYAFMKLINNVDMSLLNNTNPQGILTDRGDVVIDGLKIDVKCSIGNHVDMWVRKNSLRNPSHVYVLMTYERVNPLENKKQDDSFCTLHENEKLKVIFQGAACGFDVFKDENINKVGTDVKFIVKKEKLVDLNEAIARWKELTEKQQKSLFQFKDASFF